MESKKERSCLCSCVLSIILLSVVILIGSLFMVVDYKERFLRCDISTIIVAESKTCEHECRLDGSEALPSGIVRRTTDLELRSLLGNPVVKRPERQINLLAMAVGIKQKQNVNEIVKKFPLTDFAIMLFHYDGNVGGWSDLEWSSYAIHVSAINQTKWWFAKRFLHPDIVAQYAYIFLWDEDLGVENFHAGRYLSIVKKEGLQISQPAIDPSKSEVHYKLTVRGTGSKVHRRTTNVRGPGKRCYEDSNEPPCTGFVEMMAPVFSSASWRCAWHMIQSDLVHAWGLDFQLGYCAQGNRTMNIGIVDSEYLIHLGLPTLGGSTSDNTASNSEKSDGRTAVSSTYYLNTWANKVRKESLIELDKFKNRWSKAVKEDACWVDPFHQPLKQN